MQSGKSILKAQSRSLSPNKLVKPQSENSSTIYTFNAILNVNYDDSEYTHGAKDNIKIHSDVLLIYRQSNRKISILDSLTKKTIFSEDETTIIKTARQSLKQPISEAIIFEDIKLGTELSLLISPQIKAQTSLFNVNSHLQKFKSEMQKNYCLMIKSYADEVTKNAYLNPNNSIKAIFFMIKPGFLSNLQVFGKILSILENNFQIVNFKVFKLEKKDAQMYIVNEKMMNSQNNEKNIKYLISDYCIGFELRGENLLSRVKLVMGNQNPIEARKVSPLSIRAKFGENIIENCCYASKTEAGAKSELNFIQRSEVRQIAPKLKNTSLCLVKPHILKEKRLGELFIVLGQYDIEISCLRVCQMPFSLIKDYMGLYKFLPEYQEVVEHFLSGKSVIIQIQMATDGKSQSCVEKFKLICGPYDPSYAAKTSPKSIRGLFGKNRIQNCLHCTQLAEDAENQLRLIFQL